MSNFHTNIIRRSLLLALIAAFAGCEQAKPRVYFQPKDAPLLRDEKHPESEPPQAPLPRVTYTTPAGWKDTGAEGINVARFVVEAGGNSASVNVTPLPSMEGHDAQVINMWRGQVGQPQLGEEEAAKALREVEIAGAKGRQFEVTGTRDGKQMRIVSAYLHRDDRSWFFKLQGEAATVDATLPAFAEFLKSVKFEAAAAPAVEAPAAPPTPATSAEIPAGWTSMAPGPMQAAKFTVPDKDGTKAEVTVSIFPGESGGTVANVKRWRGQLGLPAADDAAVQAGVKPIEGVEGAVIVDLENAGRALTGAIVPRGGQFYFYKLMGGTPAVTASREAFVSFVKKAL